MARPQPAAGRRDIHRKAPHHQNEARFRMPDPSLLECFENPETDRPYLIEHVAEEFTSLCPRTGHPDFAQVTFRFVPARDCIELKSLKLYLHSYRNEGIFFEAVTNRIADDLASAMAPRWMLVETAWRGRGGIRTRVRVETGDRQHRIAVDEHLH